MRRNTHILAAAFLAIAPAACILAGPLTPPPGPVTSTYKTLTEIEPRIPIASLPFAITQPGSYYLAANLNNSNLFVDSITIFSANVTLDLNGFVLSGGRAAIAVNAGLSGGSVTITNGTIRNATDGVNANLFGNGGSIPIIVRDVRFRDITGTAISTPQNALIERCTFRGFTTAVIAGANSIIRDSIAAQGSLVGFDVGPGSAIERSVAFSLNRPSAGAIGFRLGAGAAATNVVAANIPAPTAGINAAVNLDTSATLRDSNILASHFGVLANSNARVDGVAFHALTGIGFSVSVSALGPTVENSTFTAFDNHLSIAGGTTAATIRHNVFRGTTVNTNPNPNVGIAISVLPNASAAITNNIFSNINRGVTLQSAGNTVHSNIFHFMGSTVVNFAPGSSPPAGNLVGPIIGAPAGATTQNPLVNLSF